MPNFLVVTPEELNDTCAAAHAALDDGCPDSWHDSLAVVANFAAVYSVEFPVAGKAFPTPQDRELAYLKTLAAELLHRLAK